MTKLLAGTGLLVLLASCTQLEAIGPVLDATNDKVNEACVELDRTKCVERAAAAGWLIETIVDINGTLLETALEDSALAK